MAGGMYLLLSLVISGASLYVGLATWKQMGGAGPSMDFKAMFESAQSLPLFAWHPLMMCVGMLPTSSLAYAVVDARRKEMNKARRVSLAQAHAFFMFLSASSLGMGFYAIYQNKINAGKPHFQSPHSWVGLCMLGGYAAAYVAAWAQMLVPFHFNKLRFNWTSRLHRFLGKLAFLAGALGVVTGCYTRFGKGLFASQEASAIAGAVLIPALLMVVEAPHAVMSLLGMNTRKAHE